MSSSLAVLLRGEESDGRLTLVEMDVPPGVGGPPLHVHETPHTFANLSGSDARMLLILTPAGFERYAESGERPPPNTRAVGPPLAG